MTHICAWVGPTIGTKPEAQDLEAAKKWFEEQKFTEYRPSYEACLNAWAARLAQRRKKNAKLRFRRQRARERKRAR